MIQTLLPTLVESHFTPMASSVKTPAEWQDWHSLAGEAVQLSTYLVLFWKESKSDAELFAMQKVTGEMLLIFGAFFFFFLQHTVLLACLKTTVRLN